MITRADLEEPQAIDAIGTVIEAVGDDLDAVTAHQLQLRFGIQSRRNRLRLRRGQLLDLLVSRLGVSRARAIEAARVVCDAIGSRVDADVRRVLLAELPPDVRALFAPATPDASSAPEVAGGGLGRALARASGG